MAALRILVLMATLVALSGNTAPVSAKSAAVYTLDWYSIDGGATMNLAAGSYTLSGTIGQPDAGTVSNGSYRRNGGFWGFLDSLSRLNLPLIVR